MTADKVVIIILAIANIALCVAIYHTSTITM
jgi:hypothetical protein